MLLRTLRGQYGARSTWTDPKDPMSAILHVAAPVRVEGRTIGVLTVAKPAGSVTLFVRRAKEKIVVAGIVAALAMGALGIIVSHWVTRPIQALTRYARAIRDGRRSVRPALGPSEIGELGTAFEEMRDALEGRQYVERYVEALTHEMKGPLAAIRGAAELLAEDMPAGDRQRFVGNIRTEAGRIQDLVDRLHQLSELESRKDLRDADAVDLGALAAEVIASQRPVLATRALTVHADLGPAAGAPAPSVRGERFLLRQAFANLLQNAVEFTPQGGRIEVALRRQANGIELSVADNGPGIPETIRDKVFQPFFSTKEEGTGLGLSIAARIIEDHKGCLNVKSREGRGTTFIITLPCKEEGSWLRS